MAKSKGPRPSSVVCPVCNSPVGRACNDGRGLSLALQRAAEEGRQLDVSRWVGNRGNSTSTHPERRALAVEAAKDEPARRARLAKENIATARLGNAVIDARRAGVTEATIREVVRCSLLSAGHQVCDVQEPQ